MDKDTFDVLILIGRPACGKSVLIDILRHAPSGDRRRRFHVANVDVLDDFPMVWSWLEDDRILSERLGKPRMHTTADGSFKYPYQFHLLTERLSLEYEKRLRDDPAYHDHTTLIVEFARGSEHGGYVEAFPHLSDDLLRRAAVIYVYVSLESSLRRNRRRFQPERPDGILEHVVPDDVLERHYLDDDWAAFSASDPDWVAVRGIRVPYAVLDNECDLPASVLDQLAAGLEAALGRLWEKWLPTAGKG